MLAGMEALSETAAAAATAAESSWSSQGRCFFGREAVCCLIALVLRTSKRAKPAPS